jgi:hypothetical protein
VRRKTVTTVLLVAAIAFSFTGVASDQEADIVEAGEGIEWVKVGMVMDIGAPGDADSLGAAPRSVIFDEGVYKLWYGGNDGVNWRSMYATSVDGLVWTKHGVVLDIGPPGSFDDEYASFPSVLKNDQGTYEMWYTAQSSTSFGWKFAYATSNDGIYWQKHGLVFYIEGWGVAHSDVLLDENGVYRMYYSFYDLSHWRIGQATSSDGMHWNDYGTVVDVDPPGGPEDVHIYYPTVFKESGGTYVMYYGAYDGNPNEYANTHFATSLDGMGSSWSKQGMVLSHGEEGEYDDSYAIAADLLIRPNGQHELFYIGFDGNNRRLMYALEKEKEVEAGVDCHPKTLNLKSMGNWITCYIELPAGYDPRDVDAASILMNDILPPELDPKYDFATLEEDYITDHNGDGIEERMVKFERSRVQEILGVGHQVVISITGYLVDETKFSGSSVITVIDPPKMVPLGPQNGGFYLMMNRLYSTDPLPPRYLFEQGRMNGENVRTGGVGP